MIEISVATEIAASAETVWRVLTKLERYHRWNPFIRDARGSLEVGDTVHLRVRNRYHLPLAFDAVIVAHDHARLLRWDGNFVRTWLGRGDHEFLVEPIDAHHVRFIQRERFTGVLPWLARRVLEREARRGFEAMNHALAARAEHAEQVRPAQWPSRHKKTSHV